MQRGGGDSETDWALLRKKSQAYEIGLVHGVRFLQKIAPVGYEKIIHHWNIEA